MRLILRNVMACALLGVAVVSAADQPPNIIVLLTDDQRWDALGAAGNPVIQTPNMDRLAEEGVLFLNNFVTTSICMSSRASIFTGQYLRRHGINDFKTDFTEDAFNNTYPMLLRNAGYRVGFVGKWGVGNTLPGEAFDYWRGFPGWGNYFPEGEENGVHLTSVMREQAMEFLRGCTPQKPFCLSVSFKAPHVQDEDPRQFLYDPAYESLFQDRTIPYPHKAALSFFNALPPFLQGDETEARLRWQLRFNTPDKYQQSVKAYYRLLYGVDVTVGAIRQQLTQLGLVENTVIIFTSDNGFYLGEYGFAGKWYMHEESIRTPLIIYDPRLPDHRRGIRSQAMTLNIDLAPTILQMARSDIPHGMQGLSLVPILQDSGEMIRDEFFYEHLFENPRIPPCEGVRTERWKYIRYVNQVPVYEELYDLVNDPDESHNLANEPQYAGTVETLRGKWAQYREDLK